MTRQVTQASDDFAFPMNNVERYLVGTLIPAAPAQGKWAALSAVRHLDRAWRLKKKDPEMAAFRAITSEEESATALFHALKRRKYVGAEKLGPRDHVQKNAVAPFLDAVGAALDPAFRALYRGPSGRVTATITDLLTAMPKFLPASLSPPRARLRSAVDRALSLGGAASALRVRTNTPVAAMRTLAKTEPIRPSVPTIGQEAKLGSSFLAASASSLCTSARLILISAKCVAAREAPGGITLT